MTNSEVIELVGLLIGSFAIGYGVGFLNMVFFKALDQI